MGMGMGLSAMTELLVLCIRNAAVNEIPSRKHTSL